MSQPSPHTPNRRTRTGLGPAWLALVAACLGGCGADAPALDAAVLVSRETPAMRSALPPGRVETFEVEDFRPGARHAETVTLAGHSSPPTYLGRSADEIARAIASFTPSLIVLDTCYGASTPLLEALAEAGSRAVVVAPAFRLPETGFVYAPDFFARTTPQARAEAVQAPSGTKLLRWAIAPEGLRAARAELVSLSPAELRRRLKRVDPTLVRLHLGSAGWVLAPVEAERFR